MTVVTRFAPSPTGFLHIGGARTALFNWLFTRHHGGRFLLRIEDTDRARSTQKAVDAIIDGLSWLGLDWDRDAISQFSHREHHAEVVRELLDKGHAYRCYCSPEELAKMRDVARKEGRARLYDGRWRDRDPAEAPSGIDPVIRLKAPLDGETVIEDLVQGSVRVANEQLDDMVLLRADGTATYMLAVVVDDHDMGVTHVIRGDDHLTNAFRQFQLYKAFGWDVPQFAHIPLIHGADGAKLSKRHGALGVDAYRDMGYLPEALRNYLLRLGWSHGDEEVISTEQAIEWFGLESIGRSPARFDTAKLDNLNGQYMRQADDIRLAGLVLPIIRERLNEKFDDAAVDRLERGMPGLKDRAKTLLELAEKSEFYVLKRPLKIDEKAAKVLNFDGLHVLALFRKVLADSTGWTLDALEEIGREFAEQNGIGLGKIAQPLRAALTGTTVSPGIFEVIEALGRDETLGRVDDALAVAGTG
jgi:glutamyl-tRNA synthetase